jgi:hypothetical protein
VHHHLERARLGDLGVAALALVLHALLAGEVGGMVEADRRGEALHRLVGGDGVVARGADLRLGRDLDVDDAFLEGGSLQDRRVAVHAGHPGLDVDPVRELVGLRRRGLGLHGWLLAAEGDEDEGQEQEPGVHSYTSRNRYDAL